MGLKPSSVRARAVSPPTLVADAVLATAMAALFVYVGRLMSRRSVDTEDGKRAMTRFAVWWYGLGVLTALGVVRTSLAVMGNLDVRTHAILNDLTAIPLVALLWGLVSYLAYVYLGRREAFAAVTALHAVIFAFYAYVVFRLEAVAVSVNDWSVPIQYAEGVSPGLVGAILTTMLLPTVLAALGYGSLYFRTTDVSARYRIGMTSGAFLLWFGSAGVGALTPLGAWYWWPLAARIVGLLATIMVLFAYKPPTWLRERFGLHAVQMAHGAEPAPPARRAAYLRWA